jgi:hypothetical protein
MLFFIPMQHQYNESGARPRWDRGSGPLAEGLNANSWLRGALLLQHCTEAAAGPRELRVAALCGGKAPELGALWGKAYTFHNFDISGNSVRSARVRFSEKRRGDTERDYRAFQLDCFTEGTVRRASRMVGGQGAEAAYHLLLCYYALHYAFATKDSAR